MGKGVPDISFFLKFSAVLKEVVVHCNTTTQLTIV